MPPWVSALPLSLLRTSGGPCSAKSSREHGDRRVRVGPADRRPSQLHAAGQVAHRQYVVVLVVHGQRRLGMVDSPHAARRRPLQAGQAPSAPAGQHVVVVLLHGRQDSPRHAPKEGFEGLHAGVNAKPPDGLTNLVEQFAVEPEARTTGLAKRLPRRRGARFPAAERARSDL